ncbi:SDR family NAD(P)-dependent oxidoreductase [Microbulbifer sp. S227A]|uniref:SDR family NAD(P)-dependent oxidoreductase n=1 Tax=Microbulbifer sp. S227A TaxID=3415131 RepID=UPI003C7D1001
MPDRKTVLVTGANRGLGLEFCKQYSQAGWHVIATCRNTAQAEALYQLGVEVCPLDTADETQAEALAQHLRDQPIDLLLNNAGIMGDRERSALDASLGEWTNAFRINVLGPAIVTRALLPNLKRTVRPLGITLGSQSGIFGHMTGPELVIYRTTKAAAHAATISLGAALEGEGVIYFSLRPGRTATDMTQNAGDYSTEDTVALVRQTLEQASPDWAGKFIDRSGRVFPYEGGFEPG